MRQIHEKKSRSLMVSLANEETVEAMLAAAEGPPRVFAVGAASNATGTIHDVKRAVGLAKAAGVDYTLVDAVHYAPHQLIDVAEWGGDRGGAGSWRAERAAAERSLSRRRQRAVQRRGCGWLWPWPSGLRLPLVFDCLESVNQEPLKAGRRCSC